jgi:dipeptidyl aminopeptidase/acylaminoacyl peptidase
VALTALGFAVVQIDGMGTDGRSKSFYDVFAGNLADNTLPDQVLGMQELGRRYPWLDLDRVGIWGHSGGGFAAAAALLRYPDLFTVGIAESGNHDNRAYEDDWAEKWQGLLSGEQARASYAEAANQALASRLRGKLLLAHGGLDDNVPIVNTYLLVDALVKANKDFDLVIFPNAGHGYGVDRNYMMRRRWDYFVRWLHGVEPPKEYLIR